MPTRRKLLHTALAASALSLTGCETLIDILGGACPADPAESGGIDWTPDVLHPVFYGFKDYTAADGAPRPLRIYYPSHETPFSDTRKLLKPCLDRWPLVLFLHGQPPTQCLSDPTYHLRWQRIPIMLAKSGYVVAVPRYSPVLPASDSPLIAFALAVIDWVRIGWEHAKWLDKRRSATAVAGHSYGALLAARVVEARPTNIGAYVGLSGPWGEFEETTAFALLQALHTPSLLMWSPQADVSALENLDHRERWQQIPGPKHGVVHQGQHFDYLDTASACDAPRGGCPLIPRAAAELTALFLLRYLAQARSTSAVNMPVNLIPPAVTLTPKQQFYGGADFTGLDAMTSNPGCAKATLRWADGSQVGSRKLGP